MHISEINERYEGAITLDGFDEAIIGVASVAGGDIVVYDTAKIIEILEESMSHEEALEYYDFNIACAYFGERTPALLHDK
jgi:hypothetical protein